MTLPPLPHASDNGNGYLLLDKSGGYISIGESIDEAVLVIVGLDRIVFTLDRGETNTGLGAKQPTDVKDMWYFISTCSVKLNSEVYL